MPLLTTCPITGYAYKLPIFGGDKVHKIHAPHPLLEASLPELNKLPIGSDLTDNCYLLLAYLWQANVHSEVQIIKWQAPLPPAKFSQLWVLNHLQRIKLLVNWIASNSSSTAAALLPGIRIDNTTTQFDIQTWADRCFAVKESNTGYMPLDKTGQRLAEANTKRSGEEILNTETGAATLRRNKSRKDYIALSLSGQVKEYIDLVTKVIFRPADYEVYVLRRVKAYCLDFLLETDREQIYEKDSIILKLNQAIADKVTVAEMLGFDSEQEQEARKELENTYTIEHGGKSYLNSIINLPKKVAFDSVLNANKPKVTIPTEKPLRENYKSDIAFTVAMRLWSRQQ